MHRFVPEEKSLVTKLTEKLGRLLLQLAVFFTFISIVPIILLIIYNIIMGFYMRALILCGILLAFIKANKNIQG